MSIEPEFDLGLVRKVGECLIADGDADLPPASLAINILDAISEHESETGRAWWREVAEDETIPVGCPVRMEPKEGTMGSIGEWRADIPIHGPDRWVRYSWFVDSRWTPPEPERVSVDKTALDALAAQFDSIRPGSRLHILLDSVQPLDGGA